MEQEDVFVGLIAFLFAQDRKDHPPPADLLDLIMQNTEHTISQSNQD